MLSSVTLNQQRDNKGYCYFIQLSGHLRKVHVYFLLYHHILLYYLFVS